MATQESTVCVCGHELFLPNHTNYPGKFYWFKKTISKNLNCPLRLFFFLLSESVWPAVGSQELDDE